jgi:hypothetical protein
MLRREREQQMFEAVAGEDGKRPLLREAAVDQRLRDTADERERLSITEMREIIVCSPGEQRPVGRFTRPADERVGDAPRVRPERGSRSHEQRSVRAPLDDRGQITEPDRTVRWISVYDVHIFVRVRVVRVAR